jgi:hypothetical protein
LLDHLANGVAGGCSEQQSVKSVTASVKHNTCCSAFLVFLHVQMLLPQLHELAYELRRRRLPVSEGGAAAATAAAPAEDVLEVPPEARGAKLLCTLHGHRLNGQPLLQACLQRLLWHVNQVLFNQLTMWWVPCMSDTFGSGLASFLLACCKLCLHPVQ